MVKVTTIAVTTITGLKEFTNSHYLKRLIFVKGTQKKTKNKKPSPKVSVIILISRTQSSKKGGGLKIISQTPHKQISWKACYDKELGEGRFTRYKNHKYFFLLFVGFQIKFIFMLNKPGLLLYFTSHAEEDFRS